MTDSVFSAIIQKAPVTCIASSKNVPESKSSAYMRKYHHLTKCFLKVLIFEKMHITVSYLIKFLVNIWNHRKNLKDFRVQNHSKMLHLCKIWPFYHDFHGLQLSNLFIIIILKIILWEIRKRTTYFDGLHKLLQFYLINPLPRRDKNHQNLKTVQFSK